MPLSTKAMTATTKQVSLISLPYDNVEHLNGLEITLDKIQLPESIETNIPGFCGLYGRSDTTRGYISYLNTIANANNEQLITVTVLLSTVFASRGRPNRANFDGGQTILELHHITKGLNQDIIDELRKKGLTDISKNDHINQVISNNPRLIHALKQISFLKDVNVISWAQLTSDNKEIGIVMTVLDPDIIKEFKCSALPDATFVVNPDIWLDFSDRKEATADIKASLNKQVDTLLTPTTNNEPLNYDDLNVVNTSSSAEDELDFTPGLSR